jgi:hypothetical protein
VVSSRKSLGGSKHLLFKNDGGYCVLGDLRYFGNVLGSAVELFEGLRAHAKSFQPLEGEVELSCRLFGVFGLGLGDIQISRP